MGFWLLLSGGCSEVFATTTTTCLK